ncbi:hypothetical protein T439DRAFT_322533 [Meredithblackwellia eburnea MCA 4105]
MSSYVAIPTTFSPSLPPYKEEPSSLASSLSSLGARQDSLVGHEYVTPPPTPWWRKPVWKNAALVVIPMLLTSLAWQLYYRGQGLTIGAAVLEQEDVVEDPFDRTKLAVMIEKRDMPVLIPLLFSMISKIPPEWPFQLWVGEANEAPLRSSHILHPYLSSGKLSLTRLPNEELIHDGPSLSNFTTKPWFWEQLAPANNIFFFQTDSFICSASNFTLNDFLGHSVFEGGYDWVGAPWGWRGFPATPWGGNGGTSLRRRDTMLNITKNFVWDGELAEDMWFADRISETSNRFPTQEVAMSFSWEGIPCEDHYHPSAWEPFALHVGGLACHHYVDPVGLKKLLNWCPDAKLILPGECIPAEEGFDANHIDGRRGRRSLGAGNEGRYR